MKIVDSSLVIESVTDIILKNVSCFPNHFTYFWNFLDVR